MNREIIWVVEAKQVNGRWRPIGAPSKKPFNHPAAKKRMNELIVEYPHLKKVKLRIAEYERTVFKVVS